MSEFEMTCFYFPAPRVTLSANFPHPVRCFCRLFFPATQLQCSIQPARLSLMWLRLSCQGNSVSNVRQWFSAVPRPASARPTGERCCSGGRGGKGGWGATHWSVGLDTPLPPGWHHRSRCRPRCPVLWSLPVPPRSKNQLAALKPRPFYILGL